MSQRVLKNSIDTVEYSAVADQRIDIPRGTIIRELLLELRMTISASSGAAITDANILPGDEWAAIDAIRVVANSTQTLREFTGEELRVFNWLNYGLGNRCSPLAAGVAAEGTLAIRSFLRIPFWTPRSHTPIDTALDTRGMSSLKLEVDWALVSKITSATGAAYTVTPSLRVVMYHQDTGVDSKFVPTRVFRAIETAVAINTRKRIQLPVDSMYRGILINTKESDNADSASGGSFLNNIKVVSGPTTIFDMPATQMRDMAFVDSFIPTIHDDAAGAIDEPMISSVSFLNSWYWLDFLGDRYLTELPDAVGLSEFVLELDVNTLIDTLTILPVQVYPIRGK